MQKIWVGTLLVWNVHPRGQTSIDSNGKKLKLGIASETGISK